MSPHQKLILGVLVLLLPLSIAGIVLWLPPLEQPGNALVATGLVWLILVAGGTWYTLRWRKAFKDYYLALVLSALYLIAPLLALVLCLNRNLPSRAEYHRLELMERYDRGDGDRVYLFLWDGTRLWRHYVPYTHPAATVRPPDSIDLTLSRGALGLEYIAYVQPVPKVTQGQ